VKILYISTQRGWHGGEEQLRLLAEGVRQAGHSCRLVVRRGGQFAQRMQAAGHDVVELPGTLRGPLALWRLRRELRSYRPDIAHANDPHSVTAIRWASWEIPNLGHVASRRVLFPMRYPRKYLAWCDRVVCVSHAIAEVCRQHGLPEDMLRVVHSGIEPARCAVGDAARGRASLGLGADTPLVLSVAQLAEYKGHRYLIAALPAVLERYPNMVLAFAGDGQLHQELVAMADDLGVANSVRFLGYRNDIPDLIRACDVFALVSPAEGLGTSVLDAMFAEKPVIGANAGGIPEMLASQPDEPDVGWLVPPCDSDALAAALIEALGSEEMRLRYGVAGRHRAERGFTAHDMVQGMLDVYAELSP